MVGRSLGLEWLETRTVRCTRFQKMLPKGRVHLSMSRIFNVDNFA
jgi:hypothetical protein